MEFFTPEVCVFSSLAVSQSAILQDLQENIQDTGIGLCRLFDLIEENNAERLFPHRICELSALFVTDVSGRRTDELLIAVFLRVFGHIETDASLLVAEQEFRKRLGQLCFTDTRRILTAKDILGE